MSAATGGSRQRVRDALVARNMALDIVELDASTRTAVEAADAVGCDVAQIVKSLVFRGLHTGQAVLATVSGRNRLDEQRLAAVLGEPVGRADADFVRKTTGFAIGGVAPIGHIQPLTVFIDQALFQYSEIWAAAGTPRSVFRLTPDQLRELTGGEVVKLSG